MCRAWLVPVVLTLVTIVAAPTRAGVLLQGYYLRAEIVDGKRVERGVPSPADPKDHVTNFWWDHLAKQAQALRAAGFTAVWLPAPHKGASGTASFGFDVFDDYDLGSKNQKGAVPTRYGTREQLARCVAILRANGLDVYVDLVENQRMGGTGPGGFTFRYADTDGRVPGGRFPKDRECFHNRDIPQDPDVFGPDFSFGPDLAPINGKPKGFVSNGLKAGADWMTRALDIQGFRFDDAKGVSTIFARELFDFGALKGKFVVGEFFDGNIGLVRQWISGPIGMNNRASAFDFPLRFNDLVPMCNNAGFFDMSQLDHAGLAGADPIHAVTFVENHDTDINEPIFRNKPQAYALILTSEGYPCVFYKDYSTDPGCFGMKPTIDPLIFIHEKIADGPTRQRFKDHDIFAYERTGGNHLLVALNNNGVEDHMVTVNTGFGANMMLHDYTGHSGEVLTDGSGNATIKIPKNNGGLGYVCYSARGSAAASRPTCTTSRRTTRALRTSTSSRPTTRRLCRSAVSSRPPGGRSRARFGLTRRTGPTGRRSCWKSTAPTGPRSHPASSPRGRLRARRSPPQPAQRASSSSKSARSTRQPRTSSRPTSCR